MMGLPTSVTKGDRRRFHFCRQCICRYHHSVATDLQRETEDNVARYVWTNSIHHHYIPLWDNQWPWTLSIYFPFIRPCINSTHFKLVCCQFWCILLYYSLLHYIVLWCIMIQKTLTVCVCMYLYIYIYRTSFSQRCTIFHHRLSPLLSSLEHSHLSSRSKAVRRRVSLFQVWMCLGWNGAVEPQVLVPRDRWNHRKWSACHLTEIAVPFSPKGWSVPWQFGWLLSRLSCQCL